MVIPYQAFQPVSGIVKERIFKALTSVATKESDPRHAEAAFELSICYTNDFGVPSLASQSDESAMKWLIVAARCGDDRAQAVLYRVAAALHQHIPSELPWLAWMIKSAEKGSRIAMDSLRRVDEKSYNRVMSKLRSSTEPSSNDSCNYLSSEGVTLDARDSEGETALLRACRRGNASTVFELLQAGADASLSNHFRENGLHFLGAFEDEKQVEIACSLVKAGANLYLAATADSTHLQHEYRPVSGGIPALRAILQNQPHALNCLLQLESNLCNDGGQNKLAPASHIRTMIAWAVRLNQADMLNLLIQHYHKSLLGAQLGKMTVFADGQQRTLLELCILGPVSPNMGLTMGDTFWRHINYGKNSTSNLISCMEFVETLRPNNLFLRCGDDRNALFFAIRAGKRSVVNWLLQHPEAKSFRIFGKISTMTPVPDNDHLNFLEVATDTSQRYRDWPNSTGRFLESPRAHNARDSYQDPSQQNLRQVNRFRTPHQSRQNTNSSEPYQQGIRPCADLYRQRQFAKRWHFKDHFPDHLMKAALADATIFAIRAGFRGILLDILRFRSGKALQIGKSKFLQISTRRSKTKKKRRAQRFNGRNCFAKCLLPTKFAFDIVRSRFRSTGTAVIAKETPALNYSLLYATAIARCSCRDIYLL